MKTTIDIHDELLARAKQYARNTGRSLRAVVEEGLRQVLPAPLSRSRYRLPDLSEGQIGAADPLAGYSWQELRGMIYGEPTAIPRTSGSQSKRERTWNIQPL